MADSFHPEHGHRLEDPARLAALPPAEVVALLRLSGGETVVDYGAGTGIYTVPIAEAVPRGRVVAVEALPELAAQLRARIPATLSDRIEVTETAANRVPLPDASADRLVLVDVLHHLYDQPEAFGEMLRLLRPGGLLVVVDWDPMERPIGPPPDHVLGLQAARAVLNGAGLCEMETYEAGDRFPYHLAVVAVRP